MLPKAMRDDEQQADPLQQGNYDLGPELLDLGLGEDDDDFGGEEDDTLFREAMQNYRVESMEWAERRSSTMLVPSPSKTLSWWQRVPAPVFAAAALTVLIGAAAFQHHARQTAADETAAFIQPSLQTIASDDQLLSSVDAALDQDPAPTAQDLGLSVSSSHSNKHAFQARSTNHAR